MEGKENMFLEDGPKGVNPEYMKGRIVFNRFVRKNSPWGKIIGHYRREKPRELLTAFTVRTNNNKEVNWDVDSCDIMDEGFVIPE